LQVLFYVFFKFLYGSILSKTSGKPYLRESWTGVEGWTDKSTVIYAYCDGNVFDATNEMDCCAAPEDEYCIATMPSCKINECSTGWEEVMYNLCIGWGEEESCVGVFCN